MFFIAQGRQRLLSLTRRHSHVNNTAMCVVMYLCWLQLICSNYALTNLTFSKVAWILGWRCLVPCRQHFVSRHSCVEISWWENVSSPTFQARTIEAGSNTSADSEPRTDIFRIFENGIACLRQVNQYECKHNVHVTWCISIYRDKYFPCDLSTRHRFNWIRFAAHSIPIHAHR